MSVIHNGIGNSLTRLPELAMRLAQNPQPQWRFKWTITHPVAYDALLCQLASVLLYILSSKYAKLRCRCQPSQSAAAANPNVSLYKTWRVICERFFATSFLDVTSALSICRARFG